MAFDKTIPFCRRSHYWKLFILILEMFIFQQMDDMKCRNATKIGAQQDGIPAHFNLQVQCARTLNFLITK
jgi:hypothetical protein